jgi:predicted Rossmann fold nucleotide-binding protein DprA/Smf involved in DNA uptake
VRPKIPTYDEVLAALTTEPVGICDLARRLGCRVRELGPVVTRLERRGRVQVEHPGSYFAGERRVALVAR